MTARNGQGVTQKQHKSTTENGRILGELRKKRARFLPCSLSLFDRVNDREVRKENGKKAEIIGKNGGNK